MDPHFVALGIPNFPPVLGFTDDHDRETGYLVLPADRIVLAGAGAAIRRRILEARVARDGEAGKVADTRLVAVAGEGEKPSGGGLLRKRSGREQESGAANLRSKA